VQSLPISLYERIQSQASDYPVGLGLSTTILTIVMLSLIMITNAAFSHSHAAGHAPGGPANRVHSGSGVNEFTGSRAAANFTVLTGMFLTTKEAHVSTCNFQKE
jgi:hypothetical protein